jgi:secondary thiamine-phosphate synthase enzyme
MVANMQYRDICILFSSAQDAEKDICPAPHPIPGKLMACFTASISLKTSGKDDIHDITQQVQEQVSKSKIREGIACVFVVGSTAAVTTVEYEPGLVKDLQEAMDRLYPKDIDYEHHLRWGDGNGHSHVRASMLGPSIVIPTRGGELMLGTWQQIVLLELDNKARTREIVVQVIG